jgi:hypothetical protein
VATADDDVPKLPRGRGFKLSGPAVFRIGMTLMLLVAVIVLARPCANSVSSFVMSFGSGSNAGSAMPAPGKVDMPAPVAPGSQYEVLRPGMTDDEVKAAIERARARAHGSASGAAGGSNAGSGEVRGPRPEAPGSASP